MKNIFLSLIRLYQMSRPFRPASCRFYPSCSSYAFLSIEKYGIFKGCVLTCSRLFRCHPLCDGGIDDVPEVFSWNIVLPWRMQAPQQKNVVYSKQV